MLLGARKLLVTKGIATNGARTLVGWRPLALLCAPRAPPPGAVPGASNGLGGFGGATPTPPPAPEEANAVISWIQAKPTKQTRKGSM